MTTAWKWRMFLFVRSVDATAENKAAFGAIFADNGSNESAGDEARAFDAPVKLSTTGELPAQVYGLNTPIKTTMRDALLVFLDGLTNARYVAVANADLPNYRDGEYIADNFGDLGIDPVGRVITFDQALGFLFREFGLQRIPDEDA